MLQQFFAMLGFSFIFLFVLIVVKVAVPMLRFMIWADLVIEPYPLFKIILVSDFEMKEVNLKILIGKFYFLKCSNVNEFCMEYEKSINKALELYDKLGKIALYNRTFREQKEEILKIAYDVKRLKMQRNK